MPALWQDGNVDVMMGVKRKEEIWKGGDWGEEMFVKFNLTRVVTLTVCEMAFMGNKSSLTLYAT